MIKITKADYWFGRCVKERAEWKCEVCGKQYQEGNQGLHTSHFYSRRHQSVRHDPDNAAAHCFGCHHRLGGEPVLFANWILNHLGQERSEALLVRVNKPLKIKRHLKEIGHYYALEYIRLKELRASGVAGRLEFEPWRES